LEQGINFIFLRTELKANRFRVAIGAVSLLSPLTGIGQYTYNLGTELEKIEGIDVEYFYGLFWSRNLPRYEQQEQKNENVKQAEIPSVWGQVYSSLKKPLKKMLPRPYDFWRAIQTPVFTLGARFRGIDIYHEPNLIPCSYSGPTVVTLHDLSLFRHPEAHPKERVRGMGSRLAWTVDHARSILADSEFTRQEILAEFDLHPDKVVTVYPGINQQYRPMNAVETKHVLSGRGLTYGRYILAVGTLEPRKNLIRLLRAYTHLPRSLRAVYPLVVVGMRGWHFQELELSLAKMVDKGQVILPGYVNQAELPALYAGAALLAYPSLYEGFGLPPLEAMASGVPVVASKSSSIPEVVGDTGILFDPHDEEAIACSLRTALEDEHLRTRMAEAGLARAGAFSWRRCARETAQIYSRVLSSN
jgi:alpha-1,3-rhamnosyl/mannosyltransferase